MLPDNFAAANELFDVGAQFDLEPDEASKTLTRALLRDGYRVDIPLMPGPLATMMNSVLRPMLSVSFSSISTRWMDRPSAGRMGLRRTPLHHLVDVARPAVRAREVARVIGLLGDEDQVVRREMRVVMWGLGMDAQHIAQVDSVA